MHYMTFACKWCSEISQRQNIHVVQWCTRTKLLHSGLVDCHWSNVSILHHLKEANKIEYPYWNQMGVCHSSAYSYFWVGMADSSVVKHWLGLTVETGSWWAPAVSMTLHFISSSKRKQPSLWSGATTLTRLWCSMLCYGLDKTIWPAASP